MIETRFVDGKKNLAIGNSYGFYVPSRENMPMFKYETTTLDCGTTTKNRKHATRLENSSNRIVLDKINLPRTYVESKTPIYHQYFQGPIHCNDSPEIEKINWRGNEIYFGVVKDKLAIYSTYLDNGKKEMKLYGLEKLTSEQSVNKNYLRNRTLLALNNLLRNENEKQHSPKQAYEVNGVQWPNFHSADLRKHMQGKDYAQYNPQKDMWRGKSVSESKLKIAI